MSESEMLSERLIKIKLTAEVIIIMIIMINA